MIARNRLTKTIIRVEDEEREDYFAHLLYKKHGRADEECIQHCPLQVDRTYNKRRQISAAHRGRHEEMSFYPQLYCDGKELA